MSTADFWQGYACAMEEVDYNFSKKVPTSEIIKFVKGEIVAADKKIAKALLIEPKEEKMKLEFPELPDEYSWMMRKNIDDLVLFQVSIVKKSDLSLVIRRNFTVIDAVKTEDIQKALQNAVLYCHSSLHKVLDEKRKKEQQDAENARKVEGARTAIDTLFPKADFNE